MSGGNEEDIASVESLRQLVEERLDGRAVSLT
eukprot:COSAG02_NODE_9031_length_2355_cov_2.360816_4_plen_32_part_01